MDIENYRCFLMVANCSSITEAARKLNIAQPALSTKLKKLADELGVELLLKRQGAAGVQLTPAGKILYKKAQQICSLDSQLHDELHQSTKDLLGTIKLKFFSWESEEMFFKIIKGYHELHPNVKFEIYPIRSNSLENGIEYDLRVLSEEQLAEYLTKKDILQIAEAAIYVAYPKDSSYFPDNPSSISLADLKDIPLILPNTNFGKAIVSRMLLKKIPVNIAAWSHYRRAGLSLSMANVGVSLCMRDDDKQYYPDLNFIKVNDDYLKFSCVVSKEQGISLSPLLKDFFIYCYEHANAPYSKFYADTYKLLK